MNDTRVTIIKIFRITDKKEGKKNFPFTFKTELNTDDKVTNIKTKFREISDELDTCDRKPFAKRLARFGTTAKFGTHHNEIQQKRKDNPGIKITWASYEAMS